MDIPEQLAVILARFAGHRALIIDDGRDTFHGIIARRFEQVDVISLGNLPPAMQHRRETFLNVQETAWQSGPIPFPEATFNAVFLFFALPQSSDWRNLLRDILRTAKQRSPVVLVEYSASAAIEQQAVQLDLERLLYDRDAVLRGQSFDWIAPEEIRKELRSLDVQHTRLTELQTDLRCDATQRAIFKREALDRIKLDFLPTLARAGERRDEFERRLIDIKRRIEIHGVLPVGLSVFHGIKKTVYSAVGTPLFAGEVFAPAVQSNGNAVESLVPSSSENADNLESLPLPRVLSLMMSDGESPTRFERLGQRILHDYGSRAVSQERNPNALAENLNISPARARQLVAAFELGRRFFNPPGDDSPVLRGPEDAVEYVADMAGLRREQFRGLYLNNRQKLVADDIISIGTLTNAILHPREVFRPALIHHAVFVILAHNHPSGDPEPSLEDVEMTRQLHRAGQILGIELLDHVIVAGAAWFSMKNANLI